MIRVALIEDDPVTFDRLTSAIEACDDMAVTGAASNANAGMLLVEAGNYDVLLCDLGLPDGSGIDLIRQSASRNPEADIIVVTMFADNRKVIDCIKAGAKGYLLKDENLELCVEGIREIQRGGSPISPIIARQLLKRLQPSEGGDTGFHLSERERHVLDLLARGFSYKEIASLLEISAATVGTYVKRLYRKLEVSSRAEAVFEASSRGILGGA